MKISVVILFIFGLVMQCQKHDPTSSDDFTISKTEIASFQKTSLDLFSRIGDEWPEENFVISPLSIQLAIYMAWNGADQDTRDEIGALLHSNMDEETSQALIRNIHNYFSRLVPDDGLGIFNSLFYDENRLNLRDRYRGIIHSEFNGDVIDLDFSSQNAVSKINDWVSEKTEGKIDEVLDHISTDELLFLINALHLQADWDHPFPVESTSDRPFYLENGQEIEVPTMAKTGAVEMGNDPDLKMIRMPLADTTLYMYFFRPSGEESINDLVISRVLERVWNEETEFSSQRIMLSLPAFEIRTHLELNEPLRDLGMETAFEPQNADFNKIGVASTGRPLYISRSLHDAYLRVDEKGVEGAAVTSLGIGTTSAPPSIHFDRPFFYMIADRSFHVPLFIGQFTGIDSGK